MVLLDTDTVTRLHGNHPGVERHVRDCPDADIGTTIISRVEIIRGRFESLLKAASDGEFLRAQALLLRSEALLATMLIIAPLDRGSLARFRALSQIKGIKKIGRADLLIASIALAHNATLVTRNLKHFRLVPNLVLLNWVD
jgi:tRNA(fMet)-specific endonuclease VapC